MSVLEPISLECAGRTLRNGRELADAGLIAASAVGPVDAVAARYAVAVPPALSGLIDPDDPDDPIAKQFIPDPRELETTPDELTDPIGDDAFSPVNGITHRHPDRVLLKPVLVCPVYCRFCFRREVVGPESGLMSDDDIDAAIAYIEGHPEIWEVILTGGDPLVLSPRRLGGLIARLRAIPHIEIIRIHTRVPIARPDLITPALVEVLSGATPLYTVIHCNHASELSPASLAAVGLLADAGLPVLGQTVLLKGVNDDPATLEALFRTMVRARIKPYYLHHPDRARGTAHFRLSIAEGQEFMRALRGRVSGLCLPTYVLDIPGGHGKVPVGPDYIDNEGAVADYKGEIHRY